MSYRVTGTVPTPRGSVAPKGKPSEISVVARSKKIAESIALVFGLGKQHDPLFINVKITKEEE